MVTQEQKDLGWGILVLLGIVSIPFCLLVPLPILHGCIVYLYMMVAVILIYLNLDVEDAVISEDSCS